MRGAHPHRHTHQPALVERKGVLYLNPGSAGRQGTNVPASEALMDIDGKRIKMQFVEFRK